MKQIKQLITLLGLKLPMKWLRDMYLLIINYLIDAKNYYKYSNVFRKNNYVKLESDMIMSYHSIEKGFLHENTKLGFAKDKVKQIIKILNFYFENDIKLNSQSISAVNVLIEYYEFHSHENFDISSYFSEKFYNDILKYKKSNFKSTHKTSICDFFKDNKSDFQSFSHSRKSVRHFTGEKIEISTIERVIHLANTAPSVCNRQSCKVYILDNKNKILEILKIQDGFKGYENNVNQLMILTSNKNLFFSIGERNQMYIDGGIYLMNLLYSLHFHKIASCPANWGKCNSDEKKLRKILDIPLNEQVICIIPIGRAASDIKYANSERRSIVETLIVKN